MVKFDAKYLHPKAAEALDRSGEALLGLFVAQAHPPRPEEPFPSRFEIQTISPLSIDPVSSLVDFAERITGWTAYAGETQYILSGDGYRSLRHCVENLRKKSIFRNGFTSQFLEKSIVRWCAENFAQRMKISLSKHLLDECAEAYTEHVYLVPLSNVEIERDFALGLVRVVTLDVKLFIAAKEYAHVLRPDDSNAGKSIDSLQHQFTNATAVKIRVLGEAIFAKEYALSRAHEVAGVLRFLSPATINVSVPSGVQVHGFSPLPRSTMFKLRDERLAISEHRIHHAGLAMWKLAGRDIDRITDGSLVNLQRLFNDAIDTPFIAHVRRPFFAYCRALGRFEIADRLRDTISALESLLLSGPDGSLQSVVGERLAFLSAQSPEDRMSVVQDYKRAYAMRSRAVHHLSDIDDEESANRLLRHAFIGFFKAIEGITFFNEPSALFDALDRIKFAGTPSAAFPGGIREIDGQVEA